MSNRKNRVGVSDVAVLLITAVFAVFVKAIVVLTTPKARRGQRRLK